MHLQGETTLHAAPAVVHGAQGQVVQAEVSAFAAKQVAQVACPQFAVAL
jgi:hypothetical protein